MPDAPGRRWWGPQEDKLAKLREECRKLSILNDRKDSEIQALMERQARTKRELAQLRKTSSIQHRELQTCKDSLFRLQPIIQMSDSEILKQYETLCQQVSNWVDNEISKVEDRYGYHGNDARIITDGGIAHIKHLLNNAPEAGEYLIGAAIHTEIQRSFFGEDMILFGLTPLVTKTLHDAEDHMRKLEPRRDTTTINAWRSETLKAIATISDFNLTKNSTMENFTENLFHTLQKIFPGLLDEPQSKIRLYEEVSRYAAQLEASIHHSSTEYRFRPMPDELGWPYNQVTDTVLTGNTCIDVETRKTLKPNSAVIPDSNGFIGRPLLLIEPGLVRYDTAEKKTTTLRPPKYLIKLHTTLARRTR